MPSSLPTPSRLGQSPSAPSLDPKTSRQISCRSRIEISIFFFRCETSDRYGPGERGTRRIEPRRARPEEPSTTTTTTTGMSQGRIKLKQEKVTEARPSQGYAKPRGGANLPDAANREDVAKTNESDIYIPGETRRDETRRDEDFFFFLDGRPVGRAKR